MSTYPLNSPPRATLAQATYGWIGDTIATGAPCPSDLGLMWHIYADIVAVYEGIQNITAAGGVIVKMEERDDLQINLIFAITPCGYQKLVGHAAQPIEWLKVEADDDGGR